MLYLGSDVDFHVLNFLGDSVTRAVYIDKFPPLSEDSGPELANFERSHVNDSRVSFRRGTRAFRPWQESPATRRAFAAFVMARMRDEGFGDVCELKLKHGHDSLAEYTPMEFGLTVRGVRRRLSFIAGNNKLARHAESFQDTTVSDLCERLHVSTLCAIGVAFRLCRHRDCSVPTHTPYCTDNINNILYTNQNSNKTYGYELGSDAVARKYIMRLGRMAYEFSGLEKLEYPAIDTLAGGGAHMVSLWLRKVESGAQDLDDDNGGEDEGPPPLVDMMRGLIKPRYQPKRRRRRKRRPGRNRRTPPVRDKAQSPDGLKKEIIRQGSGTMPANGAQVTINCLGYGKHGNLNEVFWKVRDLTFTIGDDGSMIDALDVGVKGMRVGERAFITAEPQFAYGAAGFPAWHIPANATLKFEIELLGIDANAD